MSERSDHVEPTAPVDLQPLNADEIQLLGSLIREIEAFDGVPRVYDDDELRDDLDSPEVDIARDIRVARRAGRIVGWVRVGHQPRDADDDDRAGGGDTHERAFLFGGVAPAQRTTGVGRVLMSWAVAAAETRLRALDTTAPRVMRAYGGEQVDATRRLLARFGFAPARFFDELLMPLSEAPALAPRRDGVEIVSWPVERSEELRLVKNQAFTDHWGSAPTDAAGWEAWMTGVGTRLDLSVAAVDTATGQLVGHCLAAHYPADEALLGRRDGWIQNLGVLRAWRSRGLASSMIGESLRRFAAVGFTHAAIGVDSDNPSGAHRLYRSLGFEPSHREVAYERLVDADA